jgi:hypothetical protein
MECRVSGDIGPVPSFAVNWDVLQLDHRTPLPLVRTFDLAPLSGRVALGGRFPGLKPGLSSVAPAGHKTKASAQGLWDRSDLGVSECRERVVRCSVPEAIRDGLLT